MNKIINAIKNLFKKKDTRKVIINGVHVHPDSKVGKLVIKRMSEAWKITNETFNEILNDLINDAENMLKENPDNGKC